ncbi:hypothetical protein [Mycobacteroides abscessus]|uniref:hypothetical protein n=1 Tax=unclassified Desemzia TaxID=2685243 RepID=UPI0010455288
MKTIEKVRSTIKPERLVIDEHSVWIAENIVEVSENDNEENEFEGYEYTQIQYSKDEYILQIDKQRETEKTSTDLAIAELAAITLGGAF